MKRPFSNRRPRRVGAGRRAARGNGFTLVEILIAVGLLGLVIAAIYSTWTAILRASKVGLETAAAAQRARIALRTLEDSLGSAECFAQNLRYYAFVAENGNDASLSFVARLAKSFPRSGKFGDLDVRRLTFSVDQSREGGRDLVLRQNPVLMDLDVDEKEHPIVLARNIKEFELGFWDTRRGDWVDEWTQTNQLPPLVRITLKVGDTPNAFKAQDSFTRVVSLPSIMVPGVWQSPRGMPGAPGVPGAPGGPGGPPPQFQMPGMGGRPR